jgi:hypothetical protein
MVKSFIFAVLAAVMLLGMTGVFAADDPIGGQPNPQVNMNSQSGASSDTTITGSGPGSKTDAGIDNSLRGTSVPCVGQRSTQFGSDTTVTSQPEGMPKSSAAEAARNAMSNVKKADSVDSDTLRNPEARSSAETRLEAGSNPCPESGMK